MNEPRTPADAMFELANKEAKNIEDRKQVRDESCEGSAVQFILKRSGVMIPKGKLQIMFDEATGSSNITFDAMRAVFPGFPVQLAAKSIPFLHNTTVSDLFGPWKRLKFAQAFVDHIAREDIDVKNDWAGLVFTWAHVGKMVIHNHPEYKVDAESPVNRTETSTRLIRPYGNPPVYYTLESLGSLLLHMGTDWTVT